MDLRQYVRAVRRYWWVILIPAILAGAWGVYDVKTTPPAYSGSVTFFVRTVGETTANSQFAGDQFAQRRVNSYVALLSSERLAGMIAEDITGEEKSVRDVQKMITATGDINTVLLTATVQASSAELAEQVAGSVAMQFPSLVDQVENQGSVTPSVTLEVVSGPTVTEVPKRGVTNVGLKVVLGLFLGMVAALLLELRDTSVRSDEDLDEVGAVPLIGRIPTDRAAESAPLITSDDMLGLRAEAYRQLRTNLQFIDVERPIKVVVVTSSVAGEGKSSISANLAIAMTAAGKSVLVIEADFRRPMLSDYFGIERAVGLTDVLVGRASIKDVLQPWGSEGLTVLPSGHLPPNPSELLGSKAMADLLEGFRKQFDLVIIDTPPLLPVTDAAVVATRADGAIIVVRFGKTTRHQLAQSVRSLHAVGARVVGSVFSMVHLSRGSGYEAYRYETKGAEKPAEPARPPGTFGGSAELKKVERTPQRSKKR